MKMKTEWRLTVSDVLKRPLFQHAEVIAGSGGLSRPIRWVHILEETEHGQFLNGGELILATGLGFGQDGGKRRSYLSELIQRQAVGLCIEKGVYVNEISPELRELAEEHDFPLIVFHQPVRFVDITFDLHERIVNRQMEALRDLESYNRDLQKLSLHTQAIGRLLQHFYGSIHQQTFYLPCDKQSSVTYVPAIPPARQQETNNLLVKHLLSGADLPLSGGDLLVSERKRILYHPILMMGHVLAYVGVISDDPHAWQPDDFILLKMDYTANALAQILMRKLFAEEKALENEQRLMEEMVSGNKLSEEQLRSYLGIRLHQSSSSCYYAIVMQLQAERSSEQEAENVTMPEFFSLFRSILSRHGFRMLLMGRGTRLYMIVINQQQSSGVRQRLEKAVTEMTRVCESLLGQKGVLTMGISRQSERYAEASRHFQEAEQVLLYETKESSPFFDDLGIYRLLAHIPHEQVLLPFISGYLGPILRHDQEYGSQLLDTLRCYLTQNMSKQETADRLFIHRQTLYHRLDKIRELLGPEFSSPHHRLCLEVALRAYDALSLQQHVLFSRVSSS